MGIFTDIATSSGGALLQGVLDEADNIARQDAQTNAVVAQNALDKENETKIINDLYKLSSKNSIIIVTHKLSVLGNCNKIFEIGEGKITEKIK